MIWNSASLGLDRTHTSLKVALLAVLSCWLVFLQAGGAIAAAGGPEEAVMVDTGGDVLLVGSTAGVDADFTCTTAM